MNSATKGITIEEPLKNGFKLMGYLSPVFLAVFMIMTSFFNQDLKGIVWLCGALTLCAFIKFIQSYKIFGTIINSTCKNPFVTDYQHNSPSISSAFIMFTTVYLLIPMYNNKDMNFFVITGFLGIFILDAIIKINSYCTPLLGVIVGAISGAIMGILYYAVVYSASSGKMIYYNLSPSNNVYCSRPKKQTFKCSVYKNGELISTL